MFGRPFAFQHATPHHHHGPHHHHSPHGHHGPHAFLWAIRRRAFGPFGPFGPRGPFGPGGPFGPEPGAEAEGGRSGSQRPFGRGDLKYALLELLTKQPMHGYEMMKALQEESGGWYTPSPGSVYPTLQMLEDRGFVQVTEQDGKKTYAITDAGRTFLSERQVEDEAPTGADPAHRHGSGRHRWRGPRGEAGPDWAEAAAVWQELRTLGPLFGRAMHQARHDPVKQQRLRTLLEQVRRELTAIVDSPDSHLV